MALKLDGSTGYLECASAVAPSYPFTMLLWVSRDSTANDHVWLAQGQSNADRYARLWHLAASENKYITVRNPGSSVSKTKATAPNASATLQLAVGVFNSASDRTLYFGDANGVQDTSATVNDIASYDRTVIGASHFNGAAASLFLNGSVAEAHFYNVALTAANVTSLLAGTKPETLTGWVDGWTLKDYSAGGTYTSIGGTRSLTAAGSVTASGQTHPVDRTPPSTTISCSVGNAAATGAQASVQGTTTISCTAGNAAATGAQASVSNGVPTTTISCSAGNAAAAGAQAAVGTFIQTDVLPNNTGSVLANTAVVWTWTPNGRVGSMAGLTLQDGTGTTDAQGRLAPGIALAAGRLSVAVRNASAKVDDIFEQYF